MKNIEKNNAVAVATANKVPVDRYGRPWIPPTAEDIKQSLKEAKCYRGYCSWHFDSTHLRGGEILTPTGGKR